MSEGAAVGNDEPRFLTDANFSHRILAGLVRRHAQIDVVTAQEAGLMRLPDPDLLAWAKVHDRILLTHDLKSMPGHFKAFVAQLSPGEHTPGIIYADQDLPIGKVIEDVLLVATCSTHQEWRDRQVYLPL